MTEEQRYFPPGRPLEPGAPWYERWLCRWFWSEDIRRPGSPLYMRRIILWGDIVDHPEKPPSRLERWTNRRLYLHVFYRSDEDDAQHDHPFDFTSLVLAGGYEDETWVSAPLIYRLIPVADTSGWWRGGYCEGRVRADVSPRLTAGRIAHRKAEHTHRVRLLDPTRRTVTLVLIGPKRRSWFFWDPKDGAIPWKTYIDAQDRGLG